MNGEQSFGKVKEREVKAIECYTARSIGLVGRER
jgi:hypothetical protein